VKVKRNSVALALKLWVLASVFVVPFLDWMEIGLWCLPGIVLALWWRSLPEDPPEPVERLPYQHLYERPPEK
jgi:hypothetical protein